MVASPSSPLKLPGPPIPRVDVSALLRSASRLKGLPQQLILYSIACLQRSEYPRLRALYASEWPSSVPIPSFLPCRPDPIDHFVPSQYLAVSDLSKSGRTMMFPCRKDTLTWKCTHMSKLVPCWPENAEDSPLEPYLIDGAEDNKPILVTKVPVVRLMVDNLWTFPYLWHCIFGGSHLLARLPPPSGLPRSQLLEYVAFVRGLLRNAYLMGMTDRVFWIILSGLYDGITQALEQHSDCTDSI